MSPRDPDAAALDEQEALRSIVEGTAGDTGERFFRSLVDHLQRVLGTMGAWVATLKDSGAGELHALAMKMHGNWIDDFRYEVVGTPCEIALSGRQLLHIPERVVELYRSAPALAAYGAVSYLGVPLYAADGRIIGQLAVLDDKPMLRDPRAIAIFQIFANRAAAELMRLEAERAILEREAQLRLLLDSAMDAIVDFDADFAISLMNPAGRRVFACNQEPLPADMRALLTRESSERLTRAAAELSAPKSQRTSEWLAGGLDAQPLQGQSFQAEATLSHYRLAGRQRFTLILRNVEERLAAERRISSLTRETEYLRDELKALEDYEHIVGSSAPLLHALQAVEQVAPMQTTVLLLGESGTGKELFARALHARSKRSDKPLVKLNCGAIPHALIESELFGHEKGAFTGATQRRDGRFVVADGGTLFLDEIGELPLELQPKLLRVLQEGELEPVGSSRTLTVDVRIVAATNRNLAEFVKQGRFREDLYYRLNVFPIQIPALRERGQDVAELARIFVAKYARKVGRTLAPLSASVIAKLQAYPWPGNVRELQNVIERGVILSTQGFFDIDRALPEAARHGPVTSPTRDPAEPRVHTMNDLQELERANIERALEKTGGKVAGPNGAAALLGTHPSTLSSRMRSLGIKRAAR